MCIRDRLGTCTAHASPKRGTSSQNRSAVRLTLCTMQERAAMCTTQGCLVCKGVPERENWERREGQNRDAAHDATKQRRHARWREIRGRRGPRQPVWVSPQRRRSGWPARRWPQPAGRPLARTAASAQTRATGQPAGCVSHVSFETGAMASERRRGAEGRCGGCRDGPTGWSTARSTKLKY